MQAPSMTTRTRCVLAAAHERCASSEVLASLTRLANERLPHAASGRMPVASAGSQAKATPGQATCRQPWANSCSATDTSNSPTEVARDVSGIDADSAEPDSRHRSRHGIARLGGGGEAEWSG